MRMAVLALGAVLLAGSVAVAQPAVAPPLADTRVGIDTLVREDIFAGFMGRDMARFAVGERNLESLLTIRPQDKAEIMAWQGGGQIFRAVLAREAGDAKEYRRLYAHGVDLNAQARALAPHAGGINAVIGGVAMLYADRLAPEDRAKAWDEAYAAYQDIKAGQYAIADKLPPHIRGELMAGLVQTAQRTGRQAEADETLDKMLVVTKGTPYEATALAWKADPKAAATSSLGCKSRHDAGRLAPTLAQLAAKPG